MNHYTSADFWYYYNQLPVRIQKLADANYKFLKENPSHPSLHFKRIGEYWSVRVSLDYRALGTDVEDGILWGWIGTHAEYNRIIK